MEKHDHAADGQIAPIAWQRTAIEVGETSLHEGWKVSPEVRPFVDNDLLYVVF